MAEQSTDFVDRYVREYIRDHMVFDGNSNTVQVPAALSSMISATGYFDPSQTQSIYQAIQTADPQGAAAQVAKMSDKYSTDASKLRAGDALKWDYQDSGNDWFAPVMATLGPFIGPAMAGGWGGAAAGASAMGGGAFGLGETALGLGGSGIGGAAGSLGGSNMWDLDNLDGAFSDYWNSPSEFKTLRPGDLVTSAGGYDIPNPAGASDLSGRLPWIGSGNDVIDGLSSLLGGGAQGASLASRLLGGSGGAGNDWLSIIGRAAPGLLGAYASSKQTDALRDLGMSQQAAEKARYDDLVRRDAERFQTILGREDAAIARQRGDIDYARAVGQPSRDRFEASFRPGFTMANDPGYQDAINQTAKASTNAMSVNFGNPGGSPNAWNQTLKDLYSQTAYPALQNYRTMNGNTGGYSAFGSAGANIPSIATNLPSSSNAGSGVGTTAGANLATSAIGANANVWNGLGAAANNVFSPPKTLAEQLQAFKTLAGG